MVKSKYTFEKRQKEIARRQKKEEKAARRAEAKHLKDRESSAPSGDSVILDAGMDSRPLTGDRHDDSPEAADPS